MPTLLKALLLGTLMSAAAYIESRVAVNFWQFMGMFVIVGVFIVTPFALTE